MRWKKPELYDFRYKFTFPIFPKHANGETRWFEPCFIFQSYYLGWDNVIFADWKFREPEDGTWEIYNSIYGWREYTAKCSLCGHTEEFAVRMHKNVALPQVCPKCEWKKEGEDNERS